MAEHKFAMKEAIGFGWSTMKKNLGFFIVILLIGGVISFLPNILRGLLGRKLLVVYFLLIIISWILQMIITMGFIRIALKFCDRQKAYFGDLFSCFPLFFKYLGGAILYGLIVLGGFILLVVPGIIWSIKFQFYSYFIVDEECGPIEALKKSAAITRGAKWDLFLFGILLGLINLLGAICLLIGLFATIPTMMIAMAFVYRRLLSQLETEQIPETVSEA